MKEPPPASGTTVRNAARPEASLRVKIPGIIMDFLERATVAVAGSRDKDLIPHLHRVSGWKVEPDRERMTFFVSDAFSTHLLSSLQDNGQVTVTIEEIGPHETYQFKGRFDRSRQCEEEDLLLYRRLRERFGKVVTTKFGFEERACHAYIQEPTLAITFKIREIYLQTPGPGAGRRLAPPEEE